MFLIFQLSATSLPCLSQNSVVSPCSSRRSHHNSRKKFGMASEPLLLSTESDSEKLEEGFKFSEEVLLKTTVTECQGRHALLTESGTSSSSAGYCFFCTQQGPIIKENVSNDHKSKKRKKSQSLLVLNSVGSKRENTSHLLPDSCNNLTTMRSSSASILRSAILKIKHPSRNSSKDPSICSSLSKLTELQESCGLMCRICHSGSEDEELIRPCKCTGTVKYAHQSCILNWVSKSGHESCELCKFKFRTKKHSVKCFWKVCYHSLLYGLCLWLILQALLMANFRALFSYNATGQLKACIKQSKEPYAIQRINRCLVSSVGRAPVCRAGGRGFESQTGPTLRVLK